MPNYITDPGTRRPLLQSNLPHYSAGSRAHGQPVVRMQVTQSAVSSNVVTLTVTVLEGFIPAVGYVAYVSKTTNNAGALNNSGSPVTLTGVTINSTTGQGTITYALSTSNLSPTADVGLVQIPVPEIAETLSAKKYQQVALPNSGYGISWAYTCPSAPSVISIQLEGAIDDQDSEYTLIGSAQTTTSGYNEIFATVPELVRFVRLNVTSASGGSSPTIIGKILASRSLGN